MCHLHGRHQHQQGRRLRQTRHHRPAAGLTQHLPEQNRVGALRPRISRLASPRTHPPRRRERANVSGGRRELPSIPSLTARTRRRHPLARRESAIVSGGRDALRSVKPRPRTCTTTLSREARTGEGERSAEGGPLASSPRPGCRGEVGASARRVRAGRPRAGRPGPPPFLALGPGAGFALCAGGLPQDAACGSW